MSLDQYQPISITEFKGTYQRGMDDECPPDHSLVCRNTRFSKKGEVLTRDGVSLSFTVSHPVKRMFVATFDNNTNILLVCDGLGNIYRADTNALLLTVSNMVDFAACNIFNKCLISPILSAPTASNPVYIWSASTSSPIPIRAAAGAGPSIGFTAAEGGTGVCDIGVHQFAVSFITDSGYTTQPGPIISGVFTAVTVTSTGGKNIVLSGIPTGPSNTVARVILGTQADQALFYYIPNAVLNNNTATTITVNFYDTDLAVSADALFNLLPVIPGGTYGLAGGIINYHGRCFFFGGEFDLVRVTNPGDCESVDTVSGFIQLPSQFDGNIVRGGCTLQDVIYFTKAVGVIAVYDNGGVPSSWSIIYVDAGVGSSNNGMSTITMSQTPLSQTQAILMSDFGGIYLFSGVIQQPPLTWKINNIWGTFIDISKTVSIAVDPYAKQIYVLSTNPTNRLLVGDYNDGLDAMSIKWSEDTYPFTPSAIGMVYINDLTDQQYRFRIGGSVSNVYKINPGILVDQPGSVPINSIWSSYLSYYSIGAVNIFRFVRMRVTGSGTLLTKITSEDATNSLNLVNKTLSAAPGRDITIETNFMDEKASVSINTNSGTDNFRLQRMDIFGAMRFPMRPAV